jgi:hypothetical protein
MCKTIQLTGISTFISIVIMMIINKKNVFTSRQVVDKRALVSSLAACIEATNKAYAIAGKLQSESLMKEDDGKEAAEAAFLAADAAQRTAGQACKVALQSFTQVSDQRWRLESDQRWRLECDQRWRSESDQRWR